MYTFEFHQERAEAASLELRSHGVNDDLVTVISGIDVTEKGFLPLKLSCNAGMGFF